MIILLSALKGNIATIAQKISNLIASNNDGDVRIIVHAYSSSLKRSYISSILPSDHDHAKNEFIQSARLWSDKLIATITDSNKAISYDTRFEKDICDVFINECNNIKVSFIALIHTETQIPQGFIEIIRQIKRPVLVASLKVWKHPPRIIAAIDPFHEDDIHKKIDHKIVKTAKKISQKFDTSFKIFHSCFTPPYLNEYRAKIRAIHNGTISGFLIENGLNTHDKVIFNGNPSNDLRSYIADKSIDILVMGGISRGYISRALLGSTTENLLKDMPCDLYLIT